MVKGSKGEGGDTMVKDAESWMRKGKVFVVLQSIGVITVMY